MCPCPGGGPCVQLPGGDVSCTGCAEGHGGSYFEKETLISIKINENSCCEIKQKEQNIKNQS